MSDIWGSLTPEEQELLLTELQGAQDPWDFEESVGFGFPELDQGNFDLFQAGNVGIPELTTKGAVDPFDLTQYNKQIDTAKDYGGFLLDNILSGMTGPGAYDIDAFTPTYDYGKPLDMKGRRRIEDLSMRGGFEGFLAHAIKPVSMGGEGRSPSEAEALLWRIIELSDDDPELTPELRAKKESILGTLPPAIEDSGFPTLSGTRGGTDQPEGRARYDQRFVRDTAQGLYSDLQSDPEYAYEQNGQFFERTPEEALVKTDQMKFFDKYGLPYPTAQYTDPEYVQALLDAETGVGPEERMLEQDAYAQQLDAMRRQAQLAGSESGAARKATTSLENAYRDSPTYRDIAVRYGFGPGTDGGVSKVVRSGGMVKQTPRVATDLGGDIVPYTFGKKNPNMIESNPSRRGTQADLLKQRSRQRETSSKTQRASRAYYTAQYRDPILREIDAIGRMIAASRGGRTPFTDAVSLRQQGGRAMGL